MAGQPERDKELISLHNKTIKEALDNSRVAEWPKKVSHITLLGCKMQYIPDDEEEYW